MDLEELRQRVLAEIDGYVYFCPDTAVGRPWTADKVEAALREMRSALVEPYWAIVVRRDTDEQMKSVEPPMRRCAIVAEDGSGTVLAFDPMVGEFLLATRTKKAGESLESFGVTGDAVGCFLSR